MTDANRIAPGKLPSTVDRATQTAGPSAPSPAAPKLRQRTASTPSPASLDRGAGVKTLKEPFDQADLGNVRSIAGLNADLVSASQTAVDPFGARIAETLADAHAMRGQEIMDSLPPDFVAGLLGRGDPPQVLLARLAACGHLLYVAETSFQEGAGRLAKLKDPLKGLGKAVRAGGGRALSSWQAALIRRTVAMLALAGASQADIKEVCDALVASFGAVNGRTERGGEHAGEAAADAWSASARDCDSLSSYDGQIEPTPPDDSFAERQPPPPLIALNTAMSNVCAVLKAGGSAAAAVQGFRRDMAFAAAGRDARPLGGELS